MSLVTIAGGGSFTRQNINDINANFSAVSGRTPDVWVRPQVGNNLNVGSFDKPFATMAGVSRAMEPGIVIGVQGVLKEEYSGPIVNDVTIIGYNSNQPRQATTSGVANGGGATWLSPTSGTGALLTVNGQAWTVENIFLNNSATAAPCIDLITVGDPPAEADAAHFRLIGCTLTGTDDGLWANDGSNFVTLVGNTFFNFAGAGDTAIAATGGVGTLLGWKLIGNAFYNNVNHIVAAFSRATITGNSVIVHGNTVTSTKGFDFTNGAGNVVMGNYIEDAVTGAVAAWTGGTNDGWCNFYSDDGVASGVPS